MILEHFARTGRPEFSQASSDRNTRVGAHARARVKLTQIRSPLFRRPALSRTDWRARMSA